MPITNSITAEAATRSAPDLNQSLTLLGVYTSPSETRALLRDRFNQHLMLIQNVPTNGLTLIETGNGWAMIRDGRRLHRLVLT